LKNKENSNYKLITKRYGLWGISKIGKCLSIKL